MSEHIQARTPSGEQTSGRKWNVTSIALWAVVIAVLGLAGFGLVRTNTARPTPGEAAPGFSMQYFDGYEWQDREAATLAEMQGQIVVLNFWASWCVPCRTEADVLENSWKRYREDGVIFLGIAYSDVEPKARGFLEEFNITYPNAPDLRTSISDDYDITGVPETFIIDREGIIRHVQPGPINQATLSGVLNQLIVE
jgi:cytochrome c biogenesis protein CcmG/thiol:disulfide interchange protein DsbE